MIVPKLTEEQRILLDFRTSGNPVCGPVLGDAIRAALARLDALEKVYDAAVELSGWGRIEPPDFDAWKDKANGRQGARYEDDYQEFLDALNLGGQP